MAAYTVSPTDVAHQRVEDEVIVINLVTGAYFSLRGTAADAWDLVASGTDLAVAAGVIAGRYGTDTDVAGADLETFANRLVAEGLVSPGAPDPVTGVELPGLGDGAAYAAPMLEKYDDMEELLLLDPIHEVDEAGWPVVAAEPTEQ